MTACCACSPARAQEDAAAPVAVQVQGQRVAPAPFDARESDSVRSIDDLRRTMPSSIFEALRDMPNVSVDGGPRASGMSFNIRGFSDREDVTVKLDGIPKSFEKYRFGGTFIDPELLKSIVVQRGPRIASGSGALGGTVSATTKDARDLLRVGERWGTKAQLGYATNNHEWLSSVTGYGAPTPESGVVLNVLRRASDDIRLADGTVLPLSATNTLAGLAKVSYALPSQGLAAALSAVGYDDSGMQPYDATGGEPGLFGQVQRSVRDRNLALVASWQRGPWLNLLLNAGGSSTELVDFMRPGDTPFANPRTGNVTDTYDYRNLSADIANTSRIDGLPFDLDLLLGLQWLDNRREVSRQRQNIPGSGFEPSIPPGDKKSFGAYGQLRFGFGPLEVIPGLRFDRYESVATGGTAELLQKAGEAQSIVLRETSPSLGLVLQLVPERLWAFYNQIEGFRPPLIDEYFTQGAFGRCTRFLLGPSLAPKSQICGDLYEPQTSTNRELGLSYGQPIPAWRALLDAKLTAFRIDTDQLLRSIQATSATTIGQPGWEERNGLEFESALRSSRGYVRANAARIRGTVDEGGGSRTPSDPQPLYNVPGDTVNLSAGWLFTPAVEAGFGWQRVSSRRVITGFAGGQDVIGTQAGYTLWNAYARWTVSTALELRLAVDNLANTEYQLSNGFGGGIGSEAPGRNVRLALVVWL